MKVTVQFNMVLVPFGYLGFGYSDLCADEVSSVSATLWSIACATRIAAAVKNSLRVSYAEGGCLVGALSGGVFLANCKTDRAETGRLGRRGGRRLS